MIERGQTIGCALSGGADSVALFVCLQALAAEHDFRLRAVHVEHGIRGRESERDAAFVSDLCRRRGVQLEMVHADVPAVAAKEKLGTELAAREVRRRFYAELVGSGWADAVATAHHMEDNAESLLLHMARGSGIDGLAGMQPRSGFLIRPFLCVQRGEIRNYLQQEGECWVEDSTNADDTYRRNFVRHEILPRLEQINPKAVTAFCRLAETAAADLDFLQQETAKAARAVTLYNSKGRAELDLAALKGLHEALASRVLRLVLAQLGRTQDVEQNHIAGLLALVSAARTGSHLDLGSGLTAEICYGRLLLCTELKKPRTGFECALVRTGETAFPGGVLRCEPAAERGQGNGWSEFLDGSKLPAGTVIRTRRAGDTFYPLHSPGAKKLKDYFIDIKLPRAERDRVPLLADGRRILWVIGHRLSQDVAVSRQTQQILHLTCRKDREGEAALR
ncbi:MAG: tRNA lysidine(34) synthetase TilS [Clostridia bacterium]|nr:tRNA lysidine(34) synthetase TilS [Clostridia bacterium]